MKAPTPFIEALLDCDPDSAKQLLVGGVDLNYKPNRWTVLHYVAEEMVVDWWLLENGADPNQKDTSGWTPLHLAIDAEGDSASQRLEEKQTRPADLTSLLLTHAANPNAASNKAKLPWSWRDVTNTRKQFTCFRSMVRMASVGTDK